MAGIQSSHLCSAQPGLGMDVGILALLVARRFPDRLMAQALHDEVPKSIPST